MRVRVGVLILPETPWPEGRHVWRRAEAIGADHAWTYDHLAWRALRDAPWFAAIPTLTAASLATTTLRLGTLVASPNFRHPVSFARELVTLDHVSRGRVIAGLGAGSSGWDATILGNEPLTRRARSDRFCEFVELLDELLRTPEVSRTGRFYSAVEARTYPGCVQRPRIPFVIAGSGPRAMRVAARFGEWWVTTGDRSRAGPLGAAEGARMVAEQIDRLGEACAAVGRDPAALPRMVVMGPSLDPGLSSPSRFSETVGRYREIGVTDLVLHWPRPAEPYAGDVARFERILSARDWESS